MAKPKHTLMSDNIKEKMNLWRQGFSSIPQDYINFHKDLAEKEIAILKSIGFKEVEDSRIISSDGWWCGMKVIHIQMVQNNKVFNLHWHDGNQEFFAAYKDYGGSSPLKKEAMV